VVAPPEPPSPSGTETPSPPSPAPPSPAAPAPGTSRLAALRDRAFDGWRAAYRRWPLLEFPLELVRRWAKVNASVLAGHLAFRIFVFVVPLVFVLVAVLGYASDSGVDVAEQGESLRMGRALAESLANAGEQTERSHLQVGFIALVALLTATSGLVAAFRLVVAAVWEVPVRDAPRSKVKTIAWLLPGVLLIGGGVAVKQVLTRRGLVFDGLGVLIAIAINSGCVLGLFWILPRRATRLMDLVPGAIAAAVGFAALNIASAVYFTGKLQKSSEVYGTLGVVVTVLAYLFLIGQIIVVATLVNTIWFDREGILERVRSREAGDAA
jgi:YihY family inner membrane protein